MPTTAPAFPTVIAAPRGATSSQHNKLWVKQGSVPAIAADEIEIFTDLSWSHPDRFASIEPYGDIGTIEIPVGKDPLDFSFIIYGDPTVGKVKEIKLAADSDIPGNKLVYFVRRDPNDIQYASSGYASMVGERTGRDDIQGWEIRIAVANIVAVTYPTVTA